MILLSEIVEEIVGEKVYFHASCFRFTEEEARARGSWRSRHPMPSQAQITEVTLAKEKAQSIKRQCDGLKKCMRENIKKNMEEAYGTQNSDVATANLLTYMLMQKHPERFVREDLGYSSEAEVTDFADAKIETIINYSIDRLLLNDDYERKKADLLGGV